jgi:hypothetical protein
MFRICFKETPPDIHWTYNLMIQEQFEDTTEVICSRKMKKNRQYIGQKKMID